MNYSALACVLITGLLLTVILVPLSLVYVEYYEYGLLRDVTSGAVDSSTVYTRGRYFVGLTKRFLIYQADAHHETLTELTVFSSDNNSATVGLVFKIDVDFTYFLKKEEIREVHRELASAYKQVILSRATDAIKNEAVSISFNEYFRERKSVEQRFRDAVQKRWEEQPSVHCTLDQFHLGKISIPDQVATKQLDSRVQSESNDKEMYLQEAQIHREETKVEVNAILLEADNVLRTATAKASLLTSRATSTAKNLMAEAQINGTMLLYDAANISDESDKTAINYIRTLGNHETIQMDLSYLTPASILNTRAT